MFFLLFPVADKLAPFPSGGTTWEGLPTNELVLEESVDKKHNILLISLRACSTLLTFIFTKHAWVRRDVVGIGSFRILGFTQVFEFSH